MSPARNRDRGRRAHAHGRVRGRVQGRLRPRAGRARRRAPRSSAAGVQPDCGRPRRDGQRPADLGRRDLRRAPRGAQGGRARSEVPALTVNRLCGSGIQSVVSARADDPARRVATRAGRRHGEHDAGAARDPRRAHGLPARRGQARGLADGRAARHATAASTWPRPRTTWRGSTASRARSMDAYALRSQQAGGGGRASAACSRRRSCRSTCRAGRKTVARRGGRPPAARHDARGPGRAAARRSARTASSPRATRAGSWTARPRWSSPRARPKRGGGLKPLGAHRVRGASSGVPPEIMGIGPVPGVAQGAGGGVAVHQGHRPRRGQRGLRRPVPGGARRSWASTASRPTSTAAPSRSAIRWRPRARGCSSRWRLELRRRRHATARHRLHRRRAGHRDDHRERGRTSVMAIKQASASWAAGSWARASRRCARRPGYAVDRARGERRAS